MRVRSACSSHASYLQSLFQEKDYLNGRFFHKRAYYLAVIAAAITSKKSKLGVLAQYSSISGDPRLTTLVLRPKSGELYSFDCPGEISERASRFRQ